MITSEQLGLIMPRCYKEHRDLYALALSSAMRMAHIDTVVRAAAFLGQIALESGELRWWEEFADGTAYEGRHDLGNTQSGDGPRFKGRGPLQLTGRNNYHAAGRALDLDLENSPDVVAEDPDVGFSTAAWFWHTNHLNEIADTMTYQSVTMKVNGGMRHHDRRLAYYYRALEVLGLRAQLEPSDDGKKEVVQ